MQRQILGDVQALAEADAPVMVSVRQASDGKYVQLARSRLTASSSPASSVRSVDVRAVVRLTRSPSGRHARGPCSSITSTADLDDRGRRGTRRTRRRRPAGSWAA